MSNPTEIQSYVSSSKQNNLSKKMLISKMIQLRKTMTYNNSYGATVYSILLTFDYDKYRHLLFSIGIKQVFESFLNKLLNNSRNSDSVKNSLRETYDNVVLNLTDSEKTKLGYDVEINETELELTQEEQDAIMILSPYYIYFCRVNSAYGQKFFVIKNLRRNDVLVPGNRYLFDLQDSTNLDTCLAFSATQYSYVPISGLYYVGTPGTTGSYLVYDVPTSISIYKIWIYNKNDITFNSYFLFGYILDKLIIKLNYNAVSANTISTENVISEIVCIPKNCNLNAVESSGPKYVIEDATINFSQITDFTLAQRYDINRKYGLYYGSYTLTVKGNNAPITILNRGKENLIQIFGDESTKETYTLEYLDETGELDGSYNFFKGEIRLEVYGNFDKVTIFSRDYGINLMEDYLQFDDKCYGASGANTDYTLVTSDDSEKTIHCLYPQTNLSVLELDNHLVIRFNGDTNYIEDRVYGLHDGQYMIFNIPEEHPIAFINYGKEDYFEYTGSSNNSFTRLGPDGNIYTYYFGVIILYIYGDFGKISVYDYYYGYAGGKYLFQYTSICDFESQWQADNDDVQNTASSYVNTNENNYDEVGEYNDLSINNYAFFNIVSDNDINKIVFTNNEVEDTSTISYDASGIYELNLGTYVLLNIPETYPIGFLNDGLEEYFSYSGYAPFKSVGTGPDGKEMNFYYGNVNIFVNNDFGRISLYTLNSGYLNGRKLFVFNDDISNGKAIAQNARNSAYPLTTDDATEEVPQTFFIDVDIIETTYNTNIESTFTYRFFGFDRNGEIDSTIDNPTLNFFLGDTIQFVFLYNNSTNTFGIYEDAFLISDPQLITNNNNKSNNDIIWSPNLSRTGYYKYKSEELGIILSGDINIQNNNIIDIIPDISSIFPIPDSSGVSFQLDSIIFTFDEIMNVNSDASAAIIELPSNNVIKSFSGLNTFTGSGSKTITLNTGFTIYDRFNFDTSYAVIIGDNSLRNIYYNYYTFGEYATTFRTELSHAPELLSIDPSSSQVYDVDNNIIGDISNVVDISGIINLEFNENIEYLYDLGNPYFLSYSSQYSNGELNPVVFGNQLSLYYNTNSAPDLEYNKTYRIVFPSGSIKDLSYVDFDITDSSLNLYYITTIQDPRPVVTGQYPEHESTAIPVNSTFEISFNMPVYPGIAGSIVIKEQNSLVTFQRFDFTDQADIDAISGWGTNTITFTTPTPLFAENLEYFTFYTLVIDGTVIRNAEDGTEYYQGLDEDEYYFRTQTSTT